MGDGTFVVRKLSLLGDAPPVFVGRVRRGDSIDVHYDFR